MTEVWKPVVGYEGLYEVSNLGRVKSCTKTVYRDRRGPITFQEKIMKPTVTYKGYLTIDLRNHGRRKGGFVHRLVAKAFIENPENKEQVNHINGNKKDNRVENLEWATNQENMVHAYKLNLKTSDAAAEARRQKIEQLDMKGNIVNSFNSIKEAYEITKINNISAVCRGVREKAGGFYWKYADEGKGSDFNAS